MIKRKLTQDKNRNGIDWHQPFRGAIKTELERYKDILIYEDEKALTKKPLFVDLIVIMKNTDVKIENPIGKIFRTWNVFEYKSPKDYISIKDFYKTCAYAYILISDAETETPIPFDEITISFVCSKLPKRLFKYLENNRHYIQSNECEGIYYFLKDREIPVQFIVLNELDVKHKWLVALTDNITEEKLQNIVDDYSESEKNEYKDVIRDAVMKANLQVIRKMKKEKNDMCSEILELFAPEFEEARQEEKQQMILEFFRVGVSIPQIIQATKLPQKEVMSIINSGSNPCGQ
jgi:hypothetical protein